MYQDAHAFGLEIWGAPMVSMREFKVVELRDLVNSNVGLLIIAYTSMEPIECPQNLQSLFQSGAGGIR